MVKDILTNASALLSYYSKVFSEHDDMTEMKMHKLLYFAQKQHYKNFGEWLFNDDFEGWVHGPVNKKVRNSYFYLPDLDNVELTLEEEFTIREVIYDYGKYSAGALRNLSHKDIAYSISRDGLDEYEPGSEIIKKENMILDIHTHDEDSEFECEV